MRTRLNQVLSNLLSNAIKFTHTGGITLGARKVSSTSKKSMIQFMVQDTGIGIPTHKQQEIFDSFTQADTDTTRKYGGTGLGLAISKKLVSLFSGDLQIRSEEGKGSTFYFTIELEINENAKMYINRREGKTLTRVQSTAGPHRRGQYRQYARSAKIPHQMGDRST